MISAIYVLVSIETINTSECAWFHDHISTKECTVFDWILDSNMSHAWHLRFLTDTVRQTSSVLRAIKSVKYRHLS